MEVTTFVMATLADALWWLIGTNKLGHFQVFTLKYDKLSPQAMLSTASEQTLVKTYCNQWKYTGLANIYHPAGIHPR